MIAIFDKRADGITKTTEGQIDLLGFFEPFTLNLTFEDLLAACEVY